ncbi:MAG: dipeptidase [Planctomycetota bacterium]|jgi:membrane dipeptidase
MPELPLTALTTPTALSALTALTVLAACSDTQALTEAQIEARARGIHERTLTLDTHKDIHPTLALDGGAKKGEALERWRQRNDPTVDGDNQVDFPKMRKGSYDCAFFIVYVGQGRLDAGGYKRAKQKTTLMFDAIHRMCDKHPEHIALARTPEDVRRHHQAGRLVACIGIENGYAMGTDLSLIEEFHRRGARYMSVAHNRHSQLGDSHTPEEPLHGGLSELGRKAVLELNRVGIMVDVSHAARSTMMQVVEISKAPVIASHSACRALCDISRNLDDEQLLALEKNGGVIQCVGLASFVKDAKARNEARAALRKEIGAPSRGEVWRLRQQGKIPPDVQKKLDQFRERAKELDKKFPRGNVKDFVDHIDHAVKLIGIDHVAISSDFDGGGGIDGWNNAAETFNVTLELVRRGYTEAEIGKIRSGNTLRLWGEVERIAKEIQGK